MANADTAEPTTVHAPAPREAGTRMSELDGVRAVAVYLVVAFHAGLARFNGGFIGVDIFFVLSGFLITHLLLIERSRHGHIDLLGFYGRRVRRLLPASVVAIAGTTIVFTAFASPLERASVLRDARSAVFYVANWNFIDKGEDYFADSLDSSPFLHLWSLAVEEQFYLVWPLVMLVVGAWWTRSQCARQWVAVGLIAAVVIGAAGALMVADDSPIRAYYGTDTRAYQLLAGAALAALITVPGGGRRRWLSTSVSEFAVAGGLLGILALATFVDATATPRGALAALATLLIIAGAASRTSAHGGLVSRALASRPLTRLGDLSYATYLWHWPLIVILERTLVLGDVTIAFVVAVAATGIAQLSMDLIERPIRRRSAVADRRENRFTLAVAAGTTLVLGLGLVPVVLNSEVPQIQSASRPGYSPVPAAASGTPVPAGVLDLTVDVPIPGPAAASSEASSAAQVTSPSTTEQPAVNVPAPPARSAPLADAPIGANRAVTGDALNEKDGCINDVVPSVEACIVVNGTAERILLIGDSHANKLNVMLAEHAVATGRSLATVSMVACPWQRGLLYEFKMVNEGARQVCRDQRTGLYDEVLGAYEPDIVIATSHDLTTDSYTVMPSGDVPALDGLVSLELLETATRDSLDELLASGARVVMVEPLPNSPFDARYCVDAASTVEECEFSVLDWPAIETPIYRSIAAQHPRATTADLTDVVCPRFPLCDPIIDDVLVREDLDHLSLDFTRLRAPELLARLGF